MFLFDLHVKSKFRAHVSWENTAAHTGAKRSWMQMNITLNEMCVSSIVAPIKFAHLLPRNQTKFLLGSRSYLVTHWRWSFSTAKVLHLHVCHSRLKLRGRWHHYSYLCLRFVLQKFLRTCSGSAATWDAVVTYVEFHRLWPARDEAWGDSNRKQRGRLTRCDTAVRFRPISRASQVVRFSKLSSGAFDKNTQGAFTEKIITYQALWRSFIVRDCHVAN